MLRNLALGVVLLAAAAPTLYGQDRAEAPSTGTAAETQSRAAQTAEDLMDTPEKVKAAPREAALRGATGDAAFVSERPAPPGEGGPFGTARPARFTAEEAQARGGNGGNADTSFRWKPAIGQSLLFLGVQHGYALTQAKTRRELRGPFLRDYARSVKSLGKWEDGGRFFTNYVAHPMQGSLTGFIQIHNDPRGVRRQFGRSPAYWKSRMKALAWSAVWSTQFEIGPVSQASIGNVGLHGKQTYVDLVMTPTAGLGLLVTEDALDRYVISRIERATDNFYVKIGSRMLLNPTRSVANLLRFSKPWRRDR